MSQLFTSGGQSIGDSASASKTWHSQINILIYLKYLFMQQVIVKRVLCSKWMAGLMDERNVST